MTLEGDSHYHWAYSALDQAWEAITDPPGQALEAVGSRIPWAATAAAIGFGHAVLAMVDVVRDDVVGALRDSRHDNP